MMLPARRPRLLRSNVIAYALAAVLSVVTAPLTHAAQPTSREFFVAPTGADTDPGTKEKPFGSFHRAQEAVRAERVAHPEAGVIVTFAGGVYPLNETLKLGAHDSGAGTNQPVIYRAQPGAEVVFNGGRQISGWTEDSKRPGVWKTRVAEPKPGDHESWRFQQLWVNNHRVVRARTPNYWEFNRVHSVQEEPLNDAKQPDRVRHKFTVAPETLSLLRGLSQAELQDVQVVVFHKWDTTREFLETVSPDEGTFTTTGKAMQKWNTMDGESTFYLENVPTALDAPTEWFLDRDGWLYYRPQSGNYLTSADVEAPVIDQFISIEGKADDATQWVRHLRFEGLKFRHAEFRIPSDGLPPGQAVMNVNASAVQVDAAQDITFANCAVEHIGSTAFWFRHACRECRVEQTRIFDVGIEGIRIGETGIAPEAVRTGAITVDNCIIQSGGRIAPHAVGVWIGQSGDNAITHCDIGDFFYTAVSVGWRWGYAESVSKRNRIEFNHLHHIGYRILSDMGGVYTLGPSEGTRVCNNVIHDVYAARYGGWGLYPDEGSTGILFENNLVHHVRDGCIHQHYGKENIFRNNILAFSEQGQIAITRAEPHLSFTFENNIVYWDSGTLLGYGGWKNGAKVLLRDNLYWHVGGQPFDFAGKTFAEWQAAGNDVGSLIADPMFVDPAHGDFHLKAGSPAEKIGFKPFDYSKAGVYGDIKWQQLADSIPFPEPYTGTPK